MLAGTGAPDAEEVAAAAGMMVELALLGGGDADRVYPGSLEEAYAGRIAVMVGAGVRAHNIAALVKATGATEFHTTAKAYVESGMTYRNPNVSMGGIPGVPEYGLALTQSSEVKKIRDLAVQALQERDS